MQSVRFVETHDGISLAWARNGSGPPLVKTATWLTHLEYDRESPIWAHQSAFFESHFDYLRYDERGSGLSERETGDDLTLETWVADLRAVVEASGIPRPFTLLGYSQGAATALAYAATYPEDVARIVLCGGFARGVDHRGNPKAAALLHSVIDVFQQGFDDENPVFRELFTSRFVPDTDPVRQHWFGDLVRKTVTPETGAKLLNARANVDATDYLPRVQAPTHVFHAEDDRVQPISEGQFIARRIEGAEFTRLPSQNHILQEDEPAWEIFSRALLDCTGQAGAGHPDLTPREAQILDLICAAMPNKAIARELDMSEKTVRNHATHIFAKLGVTTRAEAILKVKGSA